MSESASEVKPNPPRPGRFVELDVGDGQKIKVWPIGVRTMRDNPALVATIIAAGSVGIQQLQSLAGKPMSEHAKGVWLILAPLAGKDIMELAARCCDPNPMTIDLPHYQMAKVMESWITQSFLPVEDKLVPWMAAVDGVTLAAAGRKASVFQSLFASSSAPASPSPTSSTATAARPTQDGASSTSGDTSQQSDGSGERVT